VIWHPAAHFFSASNLDLVALPNKCLALKQNFVWHGFAMTSVGSVENQTFRNGDRMKKQSRFQQKIGMLFSTLLICSSTMAQTQTTSTTGAPSTRMGQYITHLYQSILGRQPDVSGFYFWYDALNSGRVSCSQLPANFLSSREFLQRNNQLNSAQFMTTMYRLVFQREPDAGGLQFWFNHIINSNVDRQGIVQAFLTSPEFNTQCASYGLGGSGVFYMTTPLKSPDMKNLVKTCYDSFGTGSNGVQCIQNAMSTDTVNTCISKGYSTTERLDCIRVAISSATVNSCWSSFYSSSERTSCLEARKTDDVIEACRSGLYSSDDRLSCIENAVYADNVRSCMSKFYSAADRIECAKTPMPVDVIQTCTDNFYSSSDELRCIRSGAISDAIKACTAEFYSVSTELSCIASAKPADIVHACSDSYYSDANTLSCISTASSVQIVNTCRSAFYSDVDRLTCSQASDINVVRSCIQQYPYSSSNALTCISNGWVYATSPTSSSAAGE